MINFIPQLVCDALAPLPLTVQEANGHERLNHCYTWTIQIPRPPAFVETKALLGAQAKLLVPATTGLRPIHGIIHAWSEIKNGDYLELVLMPRVSLMNIGKRSRSFTMHGDESDAINGDTISLDIIEQCMRDYQLSSDDISVDITDRSVYPARNYLSQLAESDWDFCMRWLEHEGIHFHFKQDEERETLCFGDSNESFALHPIPIEISDDPDQSHGSIIDCSLNWQKHAKTVGVNDYNWRSQDQLLHQIAERDTDLAYGTEIEYNEHVKTVNEAKWLLQRRSELLATQECVLTAQSTCNDLSAGLILSIHEADAFELPHAQYLITDIQHHWTTKQIAGDASLQAEYANSFSAIPADVSFRPQRLTDWPASPAFSVGEILDPDNEQERGAAPLDEDGRYLVHQKWDGNNDDIPSRRMRMLQSSTGNSSGMHFPLRSKSEVLGIGIDGDPDRGIIMGSIPNRLNASVVAAANQHLNKFRSQQGHEINWDERPGQEAVTYSDAEGSIWSRQGQRQDSAGSDNSQADFSGATSFSSSASFTETANTDTHDLDLLNQFDTLEQATTVQGDLETLYFSKPAMEQGTHFDNYTKDNPESVTFSMDAKGWPGRKDSAISAGYSARQSSHPINDSTFESQELWDKGKIAITAGDSLNVYYGEVYLDCKGNSVNYFDGDIYEFGQSGDDEILGDAHSVLFADIYEEWNIAKKLYAFDRQGGDSLCDNYEFTYVLKLEMDVKLYNNEVKKGDLGFELTIVPVIAEISAVGLKGTAELTTKVDLEIKRNEMDIDGPDCYELEIFLLKTETSLMRTDTYKAGQKITYALRSTVSLLQLVNGLANRAAPDTHMIGGSTHNIDNFTEVSLLRLDQAGFIKSAAATVTLP